MTTNLTRARRKLAQLERRLEIQEKARPYIPEYLVAESRAESRELDREIKAQDLECRRLALTGPWVAIFAAYTGDYAVVRKAEKWDVRRFYGPRAKARAVAYAEKMNAKHGNDGAK